MYSNGVKWVDQPSLNGVRPEGTGSKILSIGKGKACLVVLKGVRSVTE